MLSNLSNDKFLQDPDTSKKRKVHWGALPTRHGFHQQYDTTNGIPRATGNWTSRTNASAIAIAKYDFVIVSPEASEVMKELNEVEHKSRQVDHHNLDIPETFTGYWPRRYQMAAIQFMDDRFNENRGVLIADDCGVGKTPNPLCYMSWKPEVKRMLVVCPSAVRENWRRECRNFLFTGDERFCKKSAFSVYIKGGKGYAWDNSRVQIFSGTNDFVHPHASIVIISWDILRYESVQNQLHAVKWDMIVGDESEFMKNGASSRAIAFASLKSPRRVLLSATPGDKTIHYFPQINWLAEDLFPSVGEFKLKYDKNAHQLNTDLRSSIMIQRKKRQLKELDLPRKNWKTFYVELPDYRQYEQKFGKPEKKTDIHKLQQEADALFIEASTRLKKANGKQELFDLQKKYDMQFRRLYSKMKEVDYLKEMHVSEEFRYLGEQKIDVAIQRTGKLLEELKDQPKNKLLVGFYHPVVGKAIFNKFKDFAVYVDGSTPDRKRQQAVDAFNNAPGTRLFVASIQSMSRGVNLHHQCAYALMAESYWNGTTMTQFEGRLDRSGQTEPVNYEYIVAADTMDMTLNKIHAIYSITLNTILQ